MKNYLYNINDEICDDKRHLKILSREKIKGYSKTKPNTSIKIYTCECLKCGDTTIKITEFHLKEGRGCPTCRGMKVTKGINDIPTTAPWMIPYFQGGKDEASNYTNNSNKKIFPKCPFCNSISPKQYKINKIYTKKGFSCHCTDGISYPEKFVSNFLTQLNVDYISQANKNTFEWLNENVRYDFYIPHYDTIIEVNGRQHYFNNNWTGKTLEQEQLNDKYKYDLAKGNVKYYIQLDCSESSKIYIKRSIEESLLSSIFNISNIDWNKCDLSAMSNLTKEICDYYSNISTDIKDISKYFDKSKTTIIRHLKFGNEYNWCNPPYNPLRSKPIYVTYNGIKSYYESSKYISEHSMEILGLESIGKDKINYWSLRNGSINNRVLSYVS